MNLRELAEKSSWKYDTTLRLYLTLCWQAEVLDSETVEFSLKDLMAMTIRTGRGGRPESPAKTSVAEALLRLEADGLIRTGIGQYGRTAITIVNGANTMKKSEPKKTQAHTPEGLQAHPLEADEELPFNSQVFREAWEGFKAHRRKIRYPLTPRAMALALKQCREWGLAPAIEALNASVMNGWRGLFPPRSGGPRGFAGRKAAIAERQKRLEEEEKEL
jgi:hypothetical protein